MQDIDQVAEEWRNQVSALEGAEGGGKDAGAEERRKGKGGEVGN